MLGFDVRTARATWTVALVVLAIYATYSIRRTLFIFVLAVFFSYLLSPLVRRLRRHAPKRLSHTASTAIIFGLLIAVIAALLALIAPPIVDQMAPERRVHAAAGPLQVALAHRRAVLDHQEREDRNQHDEQHVRRDEEQHMRDLARQRHRRRGSGRDVLAHELDDAVAVRREPLRQRQAVDHVRAAHQLR